MTQPDDFSAIEASSHAVPVSRARSLEPAQLRPLTERQVAFVFHYTGECRFNALEAARRAGYTDPQQSAYDNKVSPAVVAAIKARLAAFNASADEVLFQLTELANAPTEHFMQVQRPSFKDPVTGAVYPAIIRLDQSSKVRALEILARAHGLLADGQRQEVSVKVVVGIDLDKL